MATRGSVEEAAPGARPMVLAAGVYAGTGPGQHLLPGPVWTGLAVEPAPAGDRRVLDLRTGVLQRTELTGDPGPVRTLRLASIAIPGVVAMAALLAETARYRASRCRLDAADHAHIDGVIGPDEYHERVDDNAFTNVMARSNLRAGADAAGRAGIASAEARRWRELADRLVDGYDSATGRYEQFAGYFGLEPLVIKEVAAPPVAVDLLLGRDRVARSQLIKQPDVLMALPDAWDGLQLRFCCLGRKVRLDITHDRTEIWADAPLAVALTGQATRTVTGTATFRAVG